MNKNGDNQAVHLTPRTSAALTGKFLSGASDLVRYASSLSIAARK